MEGGKKKGRRKIVVAVDESEESMYALSWCLTNLLSNQNNNTTIKSSSSSSSSSIDTTLILLYVKPPPPVYSSLDATDLNRSNGYGSRVTLTQSQDVVATMEKYGKGLVNSVMSRAESVFKEYDAIYNIKVEKKIGSGEAKDVICSAVQKLEADILVMGSHDYGFFKRALLGSVSDYCAKNVKCPVVVVKRPKNM